MECEPSAVSVAVRVRPLIGSERVDSSQICVSCDAENNMLTLGSDRQFVFDRVFDMSSRQNEIFSSCVTDLVHSCFKGYNATVLAYGQTGSGKTFTMGSAQRANILEEEEGIIPRVIKMIFEEIDKNKERAVCVVKVSFLEIYNEEIHDLLSGNTMSSDKPVNIREDKGNVVLMGLHEETVNSMEEMFTCLDKGSIARSTASTLMNSQSSRSHGIFTINIEQQMLPEICENEDVQEFTMAKFHFVDLAGSERAKRTGASGATLREGININKGLLCLGNVISALTEDSKKSQHIPYRDSKLTRILQNSLGGNAKTSMIACVSPAEINFEETLNTLKYASRARHIKNKPVVNTDPQSALVASLRQEVYTLKQEIRNYQKVLSMNKDCDYKESLKLLREQGDESSDELRQLKLRNQQLEKKLVQLSAECEVGKTSNNNIEIESLQLRKERDLLKSNLEKANELLREQGLSTVDEVTESPLVEEFTATIEKLKKEAKEKDLVIKEMQFEVENLVKASQRDYELLTKKTEQLEKLKRGISATADPEVLFTHVEDYGRVFAESVLANIAPSETAETTELSETSEHTEHTEQTEQTDEESTAQQEELKQMDFQIREKEDLLCSIETAFKEMQAKLLEEMNQKYHKKVEELEKELSKTVLERDNALNSHKGNDKQKVSESYRLRIQQLQDKLKENQQKERAQTAMFKMVESQKTQITKLAEEIRKSKQQRVGLMRKIKEENDAHQREKAGRQKELIQMKRISLKKDQEIQKLKSDNMKKEIIAKRKAEELAAVQKRQREINMRRKQAHQLSRDVLKNWVQEFANACTYEKELKLLMQTESKDKETNEKEMETISKQMASLKLNIQRRQLQLKDGDTSEHTQTVLQEIEDKKLELKGLGEEMDLLNETIKFKHDKLIKYAEELANSQVEEIKARSLSISTVQDSQELTSVLFDELMSKLDSIRKLERSSQSKDIQIEELNDTQQKNIRERELLLRQHETEVQKLMSESEDRHRSIIEELEELRKSQSHVIVPVQSEETDDQRIEDLEMLIEHLKSEKEKTSTKYNKLLKAYNKLKEERPEEEDRQRPRPSITLTKARDAAKKKRLGEEEPIEDIIMPRNSVNISPKREFIEEDSVWERLQRTSLRGSFTSGGDANLFQPKQKWTCLKSLQAHSGAVCSMISYENILYTASNKTFKVWSLDTMSVISEVPAHNSFIKCMAFWPENSMIFTGCGGAINIWDTISLQSLACLRGHNEDVKALCIDGYYLYSAGKASSSGHSLYLWDLRKSQTPVQEKEKNQEIFSILVDNGVLYYGSRNHRVGRINLSTFETLRPFEPPHFDAVSCLTVYEESLLSGSRDKNVRRWDLKGEMPYPTILAAHTDWVNALVTDASGRAVYSAGKDGKIRVWSGQANFKCVGELSGHQSSVNTIVSLNSQEQSIVTGGTDKQIKLWKLDENN